MLTFANSIQRLSIPHFYVSDLYHAMDHLTSSFPSSPIQPCRLIRARPHLLSSQLHSSGHLLDSFLQSQILHRSRVLRMNFRVEVTASKRGVRTRIDWSSLESSSLNGELKTGGPEAPLSKLERAFNHRMSKTIRERNLLHPSEKILIAVSGGQDSVCLLRILANLQQQWDWRIGIVHCDHQWSPSSRKQASHVSQFATSLNISYYQAVSTSPVPGEGVARTWRYGILQRIARRHSYTSIITAHSSSDRVETLLFNLFRGSGLHGLQSLTWKRFLSLPLSLSYRSAFSPSRTVSAIHDPNGTFDVDDAEASLVRPLLGFTRTELRQFCEILHLPLWPDPSNMSLDIDRNRIRHQLLPYLRGNFHHSVDKSLARCAEILHSEQVYLDNVCEGILEKAETGDENDKKLDIRVLQSLPVALQRRVLKQFIEKFTRRSIGFDHVERLRASYTNGLQYGLNVSLPGGASVRIVQRHFHLSRPKL